MSEELIKKPSLAEAVKHSVFVKKVVASNKLKLPHPLRYFATYISVLFPQKTGNRPKIQAIKTSRIVA